MIWLFQMAMTIFERSGWFLARWSTRQVQEVVFFCFIMQNTIELRGLVWVSHKPLYDKFYPIMGCHDYLLAIGGIRLEVVRDLTIFIKTRFLWLTRSRWEFLPVQQGFLDGQRPWRYHVLSVLRWLFLYQLVVKIFCNGPLLEQVYRLLVFGLQFDHHKLLPVTNEAKMRLQSLLFWLFVLLLVQYWDHQDRKRLGLSVPGFPDRFLGRTLQQLVRKNQRNYSPPNLFCQPKPSEWQSKGWYLCYSLFANNLKFDSTL